MKKYYPEEIGTWKIKWMAKALANPLFSIGISIIFVATPWISTVQALKLFPNKELKFIFISLIAISGIMSILLPLILRMARFSLIRSEVTKAMNKLPIDEDTYIIGAGGGSFYLIGMILKYWQEIKGSKKPPTAICVSLFFENKQRKFYPSLEQIEKIIDKGKILIIITTIATGKMASQMLDWAKSIDSVTDVNLFSLVVSEEAAKTGDWEGIFTLGVLNRNEMKKSIIPWIRTTKS